LILKQLQQNALKSVKNNNLILKDYHIGETFTHVFISDGKKEYLGVTLSAKNEGESKPCHFDSLSDILQHQSFNIASRTVILSAINAVGQYELRSKDLDLKANLRQELFNLINNNSNEDEKIVFIGNLKPLVKKLRENNKDVTVFCRTKVEPDQKVFNDIFEYEAISQANIVIITGASLIGSTIDAMLKFTNKAKMVIISGFSVGLDPIWLKGLGIDYVASLYLENYTKQKIQNDPFESIFDNRCYIQKL